MRLRTRILPVFVVAAGAAGAAAVAIRRRVRHEAERHQLAADPAFMYAMHEAFRRDLDRLVSQADAPTPHTIDGWDVLKRQLDNHHRAEDEDLWPVLRAHVDSPVIDAMELEHAAVPPALDAVQRAVDREQPFGPEARALQRLVVEHLDHEERDVLPLIERHLDAQEWHDWLVTERSNRQPRERVEFLTWVLDDADETSAAAVLRELPVPGRVVYHRVLEPRYRKRQLWAA
jgi:hypothetical protein